MKKLTLIIIIGLFTLSANAQSFIFKDLVTIKHMPIEGKRKVLKMKGFYKADLGTMTNRQALDTLCEVWVKGCQEMRINDKSLEYQWSGDSLYVVKKTSSKTIYSNISRDMFDSAQDYFFMKRRIGTYDMRDVDAGKAVTSQFTYMKRDDVFIRSNYEAQFIFVGDVSGLMN